MVVNRDNIMDFKWVIIFSLWCSWLCSNPVVSYWYFLKNKQGMISSLILASLQIYVHVLYPAHIVSQPTAFLLCSVLIVEVIYVPGTSYIIYYDRMNVHNCLLDLCASSFIYYPPFLLNTHTHTHTTSECNT